MIAALPLAPHCASAAMSNKRQSGGGTPQSKRQAQVMLGGKMVAQYEVTTGRSPSPPPPPSSSEEEVEELPPLGEEPIQKRMCTFCGRKGNNKTNRSDSRFIDWMLCRVIRDARGNVTGTPRRDLFPVFPALQRSEQIPGRSEEQPRYCQELHNLAAQKWAEEDCPTPHWACWKCALKNLAWLRKTKTVVHTAALPEAGRLGSAGKNRVFARIVLRGEGKGGGAAFLAGGFGLAEGNPSSAIGRAKAVAARLSAPPSAPQVAGEPGQPPCLDDARVRYEYARRSQVPAQHWAPARAGPNRDRGLTLLSRELLTLALETPESDPKLHGERSVFAKILKYLKLSRIAVYSRTKKADKIRIEDQGRLETIRAVCGLVQQNRFLYRLFHETAETLKERYARTNLFLGARLEQEVAGKRQNLRNAAKYIEKRDEYKAGEERAERGERAALERAEAAEIAERAAQAQPLPPLAYASLLRCAGRRGGLARWQGSLGNLCTAALLQRPGTTRAGAAVQGGPGGRSGVRGARLGLGGAGRGRRDGGAGGERGSRCGCL